MTAMMSVPTKEEQVGRLREMSNRVSASDADWVANHMFIFKSYATLKGEIDLPANVRTRMNDLAEMYTEFAKHGEAQKMAPEDWKGNVLGIFDIDQV